MHNYNGANLPAPPKVDAEQLPFAVILYNEGVYELHFLSVPLVKLDIADGDTTVSGFAPRPVESYPAFLDLPFTVSGESWAEGEAATITNAADFVWFRNAEESYLVWSSFDIYDTKGNLFMAGSAATVEVQALSKRLSLYLGYLAGKMFAGMQKEVADGRLEINGLAVAFDPMTAEATFGETGFVTDNGLQFYIGQYPVYYDNGHLIVEDV